MAITSYKIQYPVSECFNGDKYLIFSSEQSEEWKIAHEIILCLFIKSKTSLINLNVLMFRLDAIYSLKLLSKNVAQLSVKIELDLIRKGCAYLTLLVLVTWENVQVLKMIVPVSHF